jgi:hypothetical protein
MDFAWDRVWQLETCDVEDLAFLEGKEGRYIKFHYGFPFGLLHTAGQGCTIYNVGVPRVTTELGRKKRKFEV